MTAKIFSNDVQAGKPIRQGNTTITPLARSIIVQIPKIGGIVWNRPFALRVESPGQPAQVIGVRDVTRIALWTMVGVSLLISGILTILSRRFRR